MPDEARDALFERLRADTFEEEQPTGIVSTDDLAASEEVDEPAPVATVADIPAVATIRLDFPLAVDGTEMVEALSVWPPTFAAVQAVANGVATELELHAGMLRVPVAVLRSLRWSDAERVTSIARVIAPELRSL